MFLIHRLAIWRRWHSPSLLELDRLRSGQKKIFLNKTNFTIDGVGEWSTTCIGTGRGDRIDLIKELRFPYSLGLLYSAFTYYECFRVNSGEYKLMGLAPYVEPRFRDLILELLVEIKPDRFDWICPTANDLWAFSGRDGGGCLVQSGFQKFHMQDDALSGSHVR